MSITLPERLKELMFPDKFAQILGADPSPCWPGSRPIARPALGRAIEPRLAGKPLVSAHSGCGRSADAHSPQSRTIQLVHDNDDDFSCSARLNPSRRKVQFLWSASPLRSSAPHVANPVARRVATRMAIGHWRRVLDGREQMAH
jgi:hypothetical protein